MDSHYWLSFGDGNGRGALQSGAEAYGIVSPTREPASSQERTLILGEQGEWATRETRSIRHKSIYHLNITGELLHAHIFSQLLPRSP